MMLKHKLIKVVGTLLILAFMSNNIFAKIIKINSTHAYTENNIYYLDTSFDFSLTEEADKALRHGISLEIHTQFQLRLIRKWLWDKTISEKIIKHKLEHRPLTNNFLTIDINTGQRNSYSNLDAALNHINNISKLKLFDKNLLHKESVYNARIKTFLNTEALPPPLRPQAYFSSKWEMSSEWFEWKVIQ